MKYKLQGLVWEMAVGNLDIFCIDICDCEKHQNKNHLGTHYPEMADAVPYLHPAPCISHLSTHTSQKTDTSNWEK